MTPIDHLGHTFGVANPQVILGANRKDRAKNARELFVRRQFHLQLRHLHIEDVLVFADLGKEGVAGGAVEI